MKKFLQELIRQIEYMKVCDNESLDNNSEKLVALFNEMSDEEKKETINIIGDGKNENLYVLSYLLNVLKDEIVVSAIIEVLENDKTMSPIDILDSIYQLGAFLFSHKVEYNQLNYYRRINAVFTKAVDVLGLELNEKKDIIPLNDRNQNRIVILTRQILGEKHAPTAKIVNLAEYFKQLGYEVLVISCYQGQLQRGRYQQWYNLLVDNSIFNETKEFLLDYFGLKTVGINFNYSCDNLYHELEVTTGLVKEYNPLFVLDVGGNNPIAGLCCNFTSVVSMGCTNRPVTTASKLVARYFKCTEEEDRLYREYQSAHIFEMPHYDEYVSLDKDAPDRKTLGINDDAFVIIVSGNRLDREVEGEFLSILKDVIKENDNVVLAFIGKGDELCRIMKNEINAGKVVFTGFVENYKDVMKIGNLFLNPPRTGGGTGALYAVANDVPVLTLKNCDVALVGEKFCCNSLDEMRYLLNKYIKDEDFEKKQQSYCKAAYDSFFGENNLENIKAFLNELCDYIQKDGDI